MTADEMFTNLGYKKNYIVSDEEAGVICYSNKSTNTYIIANPYLPDGGLVECKIRRKNVGFTAHEIFAVAKLLEEMGQTRCI